MKDNTAQIVAQMPVDVATFLLNEKRAEVLTVETRFKVNVLLVPNRHLETPNYSVQRMRHDELNNGEPLPASFQMVEQPEDLDAFARKEEAKEPRQEAVVKGITPSQPAPVSAPRTPLQTTIAASEARHPHSWLSRMLHWFREPPPSPAVPPPAAAANAASSERARETRPARSREGAREGRGRGEGRREANPRRDERRPERDRRDGRANEEAHRTEAEAVGETPTRAQPTTRKDGERRESRREPREGKGQAAARQPREPRRQEPRDMRRQEPREAQRQPSSEVTRTVPEVRPDAAVEANPALDATTSITAADLPEESAPMTAPGNGAEEPREGGSRRRRGRRGRGGDRSERDEHAVRAPHAASRDEAAVAASAVAATAPMLEQPVAHEAVAHQTAPQASAATTTFAPVPSSPTAEAASSSSRVEAVPSSPTAEAASSSSSARAMPSASLAQPTPSPLLNDAMPAPASTANGTDDTHSMAETRALAPSASEAASRKVPPVATGIGDDVQVSDRLDAPAAALRLPPDSELVLVETRFSPPPADTQEASAPRPRRARPPRVTIPEEPLQMVETHKQDNA